MAKKRTYPIELVIRGKDLASAAIAKVGRALSFPAKALRGLGGFIEKIPGLTIAGIGLSQVAHGLKDLAVGAAEAGSVFNDLGTQTGIGTRALQEVAYAADQAGVPLEEFRAGLQRMAATLGKGIKASSLRMLGNSAQGFARAVNKAKSPGEKFELILAQMAAIPDATKRAAFGMQFFGRAGVRLAGLAGDGADGVKRLREEAEALGLVMSDEDIKRADEFGDTWAALGKVFESGKRDFGGGLIEGLLPDMKALLGNVKENRKEIGAMLKDLGRDVGRGIIDVAHGIKDAFLWAKGAVEWLAGNSGVVAIGGALTLLAANPFFAAIAAAVGSIKWLIDNVPKPVSQETKDKSLIAGVKRAGTLGGAMSIADSALDKGGLLGIANSIAEIGGFVANQDQVLAEAMDRNQRANFNKSEAENSVFRMAAAAERAVAIDAPTWQQQSVDVTVTVEDPGGVTSDPKVKATKGVNAKAKTRGNVGARTASHLRGSP